MFEIANIKDYQQYIETDESLMRPSEVPFLLGNPTKANAVLEWQSKKSIYNLLEDLYKNDIEILMR
jgi:GDPmannose 4,6-dehydratase